MLKKLLCILCTFLIIFAVGCSKAESKTSEKNLVDEKFMHLSLPWGETWENLQKTHNLKAETVIKDDEVFSALVLEGETEFLGIKGKTLLRFNKLESNFPDLGLVEATFTYDSKDKEKMLAEIEKIYGESKDSYTPNTDGILLSLSSPSWYSEETLENTLTEPEKEKYSEILKANNPNKADTAMVGPLVIMSAESEPCSIKFLGNGAAKVKNLRDSEK